MGYPRGRYGVAAGQHRGTPLCRHLHAAEYKRAAKQRERAKRASSEDSRGFLRARLKLLVRELGT